MAKWNSKDNMRYRKQEFGRAPYGDPFYIPNNWSPETGYGDINIVTGFNDRVQKDLDWWRNSDYRDLLFEEAVAKDGSYIPVSTHEERAASNNNWWSHNPAAGQAFLDNINNPEGYNIWKQKADSERDAFTPFWNIMKILGVGKQPTYKEQADLYYSPLANKSEAIQEYVQSQPPGPRATVWGQGWDRKVSDSFANYDFEPNKNWLYSKLGINDGYRQPMWGEHGYLDAGHSPSYPEYMSYQDYIDMFPYPDENNFNFDMPGERERYLEAVRQANKVRSPYPADGNY